jgi:ATP-binding cassette subfamily B (MDR/TAP) protein 1
MNATDAASWRLAMESEMNSIRTNKTWDLVEHPRNRKALPCKWVYRLKRVSDSTNQKYKARIVTKGYRQDYGVEFEDVFSHVVKMTPLRFLLDVVALEDLELLQLDVKTSFLHADLDEEIYMEQPRGFTSPGREHLLCRLRKSLYGLKQAPRQWYRKFDDFVRSIGFLRSDEDHSFYSKDAPYGSPIFLILYVDDMLLLG